MEWLTIGLAILLPLCVIGGIFFILVRRQRKHTNQLLENARAAQAAQDNAVWAGAQVISVIQTVDLPQNPGKVRVDMVLHVTGQGGESYSTPASWLVDLVHIPQIQTGAELSVKVDRDHPDIIYPNMPGMRYLSHR